MFKPDERKELRQFFFEIWRKYKAKELLQPLEAEVLYIMLQHPEYLGLFEQPEKHLEQDFQEANPFLHLSLHQALKEQVQTDRPPGIAAVHQQLASYYQDAHAAEHAIMEILAETLWESMRKNQAPDEQHYLMRLRQLLPYKSR